MDLSVLTASIIHMQAHTQDRHINVWPKNSSYNKILPNPTPCLFFSKVCWHIFIKWLSFYHFYCLFHFNCLFLDWRQWNQCRWGWWGRRGGWWGGRRRNKGFWEQQPRWSNFQGCKAIQRWLQTFPAGGEQQWFLNENTILHTRTVYWKNVY